MTVDCNARMVNADPEEGCAMAVAEAARTLYVLVECLRQLPTV